MGKKVIVAVIGAILLVGGIVGIVYGVTNLGTKKAANPNVNITAQFSIGSLCSTTDNPDRCNRTLSSAGSTNNSTHLITTSIKAVVDEFSSVAGKTDDIIKSVKPDEMNQLAINDCKELFEMSMEQLKEALHMVGGPDSLANQSQDLRIWLSAALAYTETCIDGLTIPELQKLMRDGLKDANELNSIALTLVTVLTSDDVEDLLKGITKVNSNRRLLSTQEDQEFPTWMSVVDRKLLGENGVVGKGVKKGGHKRGGHRRGGKGRKKRGGKGRKKRRGGGHRHHQKQNGGNQQGNNAGPGQPNVVVVAAQVNNDVVNNPGPGQPNVVVAQDGSGNYRTIKEAVNAIPKKNAEKFIIYVKAGVYRENVIVKSTNVYMYGDGPTRTVVTGNKHNPVPTFQTPTLAIAGQNFIIRGMGIENTAGPSAGQAVALRASCDKAAFIDCHFRGYQDTLYAHTGRQFYRDCVITGTIDFIFGDGAVIIQNSQIIVRKGKPSGANMVTAQGRIKKDEPTGTVIQNCHIFPEPEFVSGRLSFPNYLGRPWKPYSRTMIIESTIDDLIRPEGWAEWQGSPQHDNTLTYGEYNNNGAGANLNGRVNWPGYTKDIGRQEAEKYTVGPFIDNKGENWLQAAGLPYDNGLKP